MFIALLRFQLWRKSMVNPTQPNPTPAELEILHILWSLGEAKVKAINDTLSESKPVGYTTTLKTMQIMEQKGMLGRRKDGKSHIYFPLSEQAETRTSMLDRLLENVFGGSKSQLVMHLLGTKKVSVKELEEIKAFLKKMEK
jgi:BlaI family transcriptional regulator, penicillinase repressor